MKKLNIMVLFDSAGTPPEDQDFTDAFKTDAWLTEAAIVDTLQTMGHEVRTFGIYDDITILIKELDQVS